MSNELSEVSTVNDSSREKTIIKTSIIGIIANVFLAAFKAVIGLMTHSIAIVLDAVNNISDAGSSLITIIGTKLAGREPDKKHPFGYGRIEYLSAMIISVIVLYAGVTSFIESVKKIISPQTPEYSIASLVIVGVAVVVKIVLGRYVKSVGTKVNSDSLVNSGEDATLDSIISASTLVAAVIFMIFGLSLEAWLGAIISLVIIKSGFEMLKDTISQILGERSDPDLAKSIKQTVTEFEGVEGAYDLVLNNYGPDAWNGSVHIEVPDTYSADQLDRLIREIQMKVYREHQVILTAIGVYSINTKDDEAKAIEQKVREIVFTHEHVLQIACVCNIVGDLLFVAVFHLGASGAALATVIAQLISVLISFLIIRKTKLPFAFDRTYLKYEKPYARTIIRIGTPIALQDFLVGISFLVMLAIVNQLGLTASAGVGVAEKVCAFIMLVPAAFMQSMSAFVAQNYGAGHIDRAVKALKTGIAVSVFFGVVMFFVTFFHGDLLAGIFSNKPDTVADAWEYLKAYAIDCLLTCFLFCFIGFYNGLGKTRFVMIQGMIGAFLVRIPVAFLMQHIGHGSLFLIGLATPCSTVLQIGSGLGAILLAVLAVFGVKKFKRRRLA